jgi:hypothetical protein
MASEVWTFTAPGGFVHVKYDPGVDAYPVEKEVFLDMPAGYNPNTHGPAAPAVTPLLQGFDVDYGTEGDPVDHHVRQLRIDVLYDVEHGWYNLESPDRPDQNYQGPKVKVIVGLRDDSGGPPPDDPFVAWLHISALAVY